MVIASGLLLARPDSPVEVSDSETPHQPLWLLPGSGVRSCFLLRERGHFGSGVTFGSRVTGAGSTGAGSGLAFCLGAFG